MEKYKPEQSKRKDYETYMSEFRNKKTYFKCFHLPEDKKYFSGKTIFDVGPGKSDFVEYIRKEYPDCNIVPIEPQAFRRKAYLEKQGSNYLESVAARAQELPFKAESADEILASFSMPYHAENDYQGLRSIYEMLRCLKKGGLLKITPLNDPDGFRWATERWKGLSHQGLKALKKILEECKLSHSFYCYAEPEDICTDFPEESYTFIIKRETGSLLGKFKEYIVANKKKLEKQKTKDL